MIDEMGRRAQEIQARSNERARTTAIAMILDDFRKRFEMGNPAFAWLAYHFCWKTKAPMPMWVNDYLAQAASAIVELIRQPPGRDVGVALASALEMKTRRGATGFLSAARHADQASELLRFYRMFRFAGRDHPTAWKKLAAASRLSDGFVLEKRIIQRRLDEHYPGWRHLDFEPPSLEPEP